MMIIKFLLLFTSVSMSYGKFPATSDKFISEINRKAKTWKAGRNFDEKIPLKNIKILMGVLPDAHEYLPKETIYHDTHTDTLPENYDAREAYPNCPTIRDIRDQGVCGSCWAVSATSVITDRICILSNGTKNFRLSENHLLSCCHICGFGCYGGIPTMAWFYYGVRGIVTGGPYASNEGCQPYTFRPCSHFSNDTNMAMCDIKEFHNPKCTNACVSGYKIPFVKDKHFSEDNYKVPQNVTQIQLEIFKNGPVQGTFTVYEDFLNYKSGVYQQVHGKITGKHAIKIIGWGVENGVDYWLVSNSWNTNWGDNGMFKIIRGTNHCNIEDGILAGIPDLSR